MNEEAPAVRSTPLTLPARRALVVQVAALPVLAAGLGWSPAAHADGTIANNHDAINKAGRLRMLSQRMAKAWLAMGQRVEPTKAQAILQASIDTFDQHLDQLKGYAPTAPILGTYAALDPVWRAYKAALLQGPPDRALAVDIQAHDAKVLKLAQQGTVQLEAHAARPTGKLVNISGRQRMLSQKAAKLYLSVAWGTASPEQVAELQQVRLEFSQALTLLQEAKESHAALLEVLDIAQQQWVFFDNALAKAGQRGNPPQHAREVFASSENILQIMDRATSMYSRLA